MDTSKTSKTEDLLLKGKILEAWPYKEGAWALSCTPVTAIDKVKFSFFKKGQNGKGFDIFVDGIVFLSLMDTLRRCNFNLPEKWEYKTGEKGSKIVSIEKGTSALLAVHGFGGDKENSATIGINRAQAEEMLALWQMFFKTKFEEKWRAAFEKGQNRKPETAQPDDSQNSENSQENNSIEFVIGSDIKDHGKFRCVTITLDDGNVGKLWVEQADISLTPGTKAKAEVEIKDDNYKLVRMF